jgi:hypothetical protein
MYREEVVPAWRGENLIVETCIMHAVSAFRLGW